MQDVKLFILEEKKEDGTYGEPNENVCHATTLSAGFDLTAAESATIAPGQRLLVDTGLRIKESVESVTIETSVGPLLAVPEIQVRPRSGLANKKGISVLNTPGTIDADYRGPIKVMLINHGAENFLVARGDAIAQAVVSLAIRSSNVVTKSTVRGEGGFGSTTKPKA